MIYFSLKAFIVTLLLTTSILVLLCVRSYWYRDGAEFVDGQGFGSVWIDSGRFIRIYQPTAVPSGEKFQIDHWNFGMPARGLTPPVLSRGLGISRGHWFSSMAKDTEFLTFPLWWDPVAFGSASLFGIVLLILLKKFRHRWKRGFDVTQPPSLPT